jgi:hypothetical protein
VSAASSPRAYSAPAATTSKGHCNARSIGSSTTARPARSGRVIAKRVSAAMRNSASAEKITSRVKADGPWWKSGGGRRSRVPSGMGAQRATKGAEEEGVGGESIDRLSQGRAARRATT